MDETPERPVTIRHYRQLANQIVEKHFGKPPNRIVYRRSGRTNYVFAVNHLEGQFVIRISPDAERIEAFRKELWATQKAREAGVPSSEVLEVDSDADSEPYMISRRVTGAEATHHPQRERIIHEMGRYARLINSIHTKHFGSNFDWTNNGDKNRTWTNYLENELDYESRLELLSKHKILADREVKRLRRIIEQSKALRIKPCLNHGDLRLKNVIVDEDGEIAAIVDWEECVSTIAPQWDLSISLHDLSIDEKQLFIDGYGLSNEQMTEMAPLIKAFNIINYANAVERAVEVRDNKMLAEFKLRLSGSFDLYSF
ncbi:MAG TPA: aminoglycoside phosphotransferase family protein [Pyrinomonadaceae bacterium]|nr:aminoglycoside phosphotransferase family protein [Pyrinomonadaceae bacterium]